MMEDNVVNFHPSEEAMMIAPSKVYLGFNAEEKMVTMTFCGDEEGSEISFVFQPDDLLWLEKEMVRVKKLAGI